MSKKTACGIVASVLALTVLACGAATPAPQLAYDAEEAPAEAPAAFAGDDADRASTGRMSNTAVDSTVERLIIRNASLDLVVADSEAALDEVADLAEELDGYVVESNTYKYQEGLQALLWDLTKGVI